MKKYDVHFNVVFSDFFTIAAESPSEADQIVKDWLKNCADITKKKLIYALTQDIECGWLDFALTETLERE